MNALDGRFIIENSRSMSNDKIGVENPATLEPLGEAFLASADDCRRAVEAARRAFPMWRDISLREKQRIFLNAKEILLRRAHEIAELITREKGTPLVESLTVEVFSVLEALDYYGRNQKRSLAPRKVRPHVPLFAHKKCRYLFQPLGPSMVISPWNFPFLIPFLDIISELTAGNTIIFRPSTSTPFTGLAVGEIMVEAGLPAGVLNTVPCRVPQAEEMIVNPVVQSVNFTGSVSVGKRIMELASRNLTKIVLELGGKDPMIVLRDADLEMAARGAVWEAFMNTGQSCASVERVYVDAEIAEEFKRRVVEFTTALRVGNPLDPEVDVGPMENMGQLKVVEEHVRDAREKGAEVLCGGERLAHLPGYFYAPIVLARVDHTMKIMTEETFGPALPIMTFSDVEEAVALANDSRYGLTASVWTRDRKLAARLAERLETGSVTVNDHMLTFNEPRAIWGGVKQTGRGRTHGPYGLLELTNIKFVCADFSKKHTKIWWYPYAPSKLPIMEKSLALMHHRRRGKKVKALLSLLPHMEAVSSTTPFRSLLKITSRLFRR
ncbi:MAG: aldehyde dehydrogenase family protein [Candidatus Aminicenantales bacterium]